MKKKREKSAIILLVLAVILMTVGFAAYAQTLTINGNVKVKGSSWDVRYIKNQIVTSQNSVTATSATVEDTDFTFGVTLEKPGDFYEATITVKNYGTIDAVLDQIKMSSLTEAQQKYLSYTVTYDNGTPYSAQTDTGLNIDLAAGAEKTVVVRVEYLQPANSTDLPSEEETTVTVSGSLEYKQK